MFNFSHERTWQRTSLLPPPKRIIGLAPIPSLLWHHFGMFDFNTADPAAAREGLSRARPPVRVLFAAGAKRYSVDP